MSTQKPRPRPRLPRPSPVTVTVFLRPRFQITASHGGLDVRVELTPREQVRPMAAANG